MQFVSASAFYEKSMEVLNLAGIPFLVGGAYAFRAYAGIVRDTKDFDLMIRRRDLDGALSAFRSAGFRADVLFPHWIAKVHYGESFIDIIFNSGNGLCPVDEAWFEHARKATVLGQEAALCPPEEIIWQKAYIMERERFDGADVAHLIKCCGDELDWPRLVGRFGSDAAVLLAHLLLVQFIYPDERNLVPGWVLERLTAESRSAASDADRRLCQGTLLSREQYLPDIERWSYSDARLERRSLNEEDLKLWTSAIESPQKGR